MIFTFRKPPSINHIYGYTCQRGFARSYITKEGKDWFEEASLLLKTQWNKITFTEPCGVRIILYTNRMTQDVDNILKPTLDLLQKTGVVTNDNLVWDLHIKKEKVAKDEEKIVIEIFPLDNNE